MSGQRRNSLLVAWAILGIQGSALILLHQLFVQQAAANVDQVAFLQGANTVEGISVAPLLWSPKNDLEEWLQRQEHISAKKLLANVQPVGTASGCVVAAQSRREPNYWYYWARDGALVMETLLNMYESKEGSEKEKIALETILWNYIDFNLHLQTIKTRSISKSDPLGLGEPKYNVDATAFMSDWGRPQNDGPALRAIASMRFARAYLKRGGSLDLVRNKIYRNVFPANTLVKRDLEMVARNWNQPSYCLWEEVKGQHFYTLAVQLKALQSGAEFALLFNDTSAAEYYHSQAGQTTTSLMQHMNCRSINVDSNSKRYVLATLNRVGGLDYKHENLDVAVILGILHSQAHHLLRHECVLATLWSLKTRFSVIYDINRHTYRSLAPGIGRYPEDQYYGGNPWFLCTLAFSQYYYRLLSAFTTSGSIEVTEISAPFFNSLPNIGLIAPGVYPCDCETFTDITSRLAQEADSFITRVRTHLPADGTMDEQFNRTTGFMLSAKDLTWSYAALLTATRIRKLVRNAQYFFNRKLKLG